MDALETARAAIAKRAKDPRAIAFGFSGDLNAIGRALDELELRIGTLAAVALAKHYWPAASLHAGQWDALSKMSELARHVYREGTHGKACLCEQCCLYRLTEVKR